MSPDRIEQRMALALQWWAKRVVDLPTSARLGTGAISELETWFAGHVRHAHAFAVGSGTMALLAAFLTCSVGPNTVLLLPEHDWTASVAASRLLGASPVRVPAGDGGVITPQTVSGTCHTDGPIVCVVSHLNGHVADSAAIRRVLPADSIIIDDISQSVDGVHDGEPVGVTADFVCTSLSHGKRLDAGEGGLVSCRDEAVADRLCSVSQHPMRQYVSQLASINDEVVVSRMHACAAILALHCIETLGSDTARSTDG